MPSLLIEHGDQSLRIPLRGQVRIGRNAENRIVIPEESVRPVHACIFADEHRCIIKHLSGSGGSTEVNGELVTDQRLLQEGDLIRIGTARITIESSADSSADGNGKQQAESVEFIRFHCECGARIKARAALAGRRGQCTKCGQVLTIPRPGEDEKAIEVVDFEEDADSVGVEEFCSVCQTVIEPDDERTLCDECGLPFHDECWLENFGCSAYGCGNVNVLKPGPDLSIHNPPPPPPGYGAPAQPPGFAPFGAATSHLGGTGAANPSAANPPIEDTIPWEFLILAATTLAAVIGFCTFGIPPLLVGAGAVVYAIMAMNQSRQVKMPILGIAMGVGALGFIMGIIVSMIVWFG